MKANYIVTVTTPDRVGIVQCVTRVVRDRGGNVLEASQTVMRAFFTIILAVEFDEPQDRDELIGAIEAGGAQFGLSVDAIEADGREAQPAPAAGERFLVTILSQDRPGLLQAISASLAGRGVNIHDLHARTDAGRLMLVMEVYLPRDLNPSTLRAELGQVGPRLGVGMEIYVQHENIFLATSEPRPVRVGPLADLPEGAAVVPH